MYESAYSVSTHNRNRNCSFQKRVFFKYLPSSGQHTELAPMNRCLSGSRNEMHAQFVTKSTAAPP
jgi:hypothetical protein